MLDPLTSQAYAVLQNGTPIARELALTFALYRLIHPRRVIKFAAGRETDEDSRFLSALTAFSE